MPNAQCPIPNSQFPIQKVIVDVFRKFIFQKAPKAFPAGRISGSDFYSGTDGNSQRLAGGRVRGEPRYI
ncbi:MAG: hypothetical protein F6J93_18855 [Oscillatoria sp. SIO1A7]|nr:hypothetical protein [Oscillatoria sp. SIO1A7]